MIFRQIGKYYLGHKLGFGQHSKVRIAMKGNEKFALKYIKLIKTPENNEHYKKLIFNEANVMRQLNNPHILKLYDFNYNGVYIKPNGKLIPVAYIVIELLPKGELFDYIAIKERLPENFGRFYFRQLINTLEFMHSKGIIHRDIKAENILLDNNYELKIADFGFSVPINGWDGSGKLCSFKGTRSYMAPEFYVNEPYDGIKVDIFACGVLLFIMVMGTLPFNTAEYNDVKYIVLHSDYMKYWESASSILKSEKVSMEFFDLFRSMVFYDPNKRLNLEQVKAHPWFNGPIPTIEEIKKEFEERKVCLENRRLRIIEEDKKSKNIYTKQQMKNGCLTNIIFHGTKTGEKLISIDHEIKHYEKVISY